jgi:hypothetical protein
VSITRLPTPKGHKCRHVHYSGRRCAVLVFEPKEKLCTVHRRTDGEWTTKCDDCAAMKRAFPLRKELDSRKEELPF